MNLLPPTPGKAFIESEQPKSQGGLSIYAGTVKHLRSQESGASIASDS